MKRSKLAFLFLFLVLLMVYILFLKHHYSSFGPSSFRLPPHLQPASDRTKATRSNSSDGDRYLYGIMFDAGSTGTRVHIFRFQMENEAPRLDHETFRAIKPGLSAYADDPQKCSAGIMELLDVARSTVPPSKWTRTPVVLKATAGLRMLPGEKANKLLDRVRALFQNSPFQSRDDSVSIMEGTDEGSPTVGMLDLGGGSTQITFSPRDEVRKVLRRPAEQNPLCSRSSGGRRSLLGRPESLKAGQRVQLTSDLQDGVPADL
uniref:nucleoside diphosphate phosphatase n=1 Tax=Fundulus heteroclitus TaxID=8078 RepID=A0A3Q2QFC9_FUNHE